MQQQQQLQLQQQPRNGDLGRVWSRSLSDLAQRMGASEPSAADLALYKTLQGPDLAAVQAMMLPSQM